MKKDSLLRRNTAAIVGLGLIATPLVALSTPAFAVADPCDAIEPGATEVAPEVCEFQFVEEGAFTFTAPSGITKMTAVIVGAGGGPGFDGVAINYAGGGGAVIYVPSVDVSAPLDVVVGLGADDGTAQGGSSSVNDDIAAGGHSGMYTAAGTGWNGGGASGNGNSGWESDMGGAGGGAGGAAPTQFEGGPGLTPSAVANDAELWPAVVGETAYGAGGLQGTTVDSDYTPGKGSASDGFFGNDGLVILRWTTKAAELPATGFNAGAFAAFAAAFMIPGAALLAFATRGRRKQAQR